jgi:type IV pilus assembly protein PilM
MVKGVGLEISLNKVKALHLEVTGSQVKVLNFSQKEIPPEEQNWQEAVTEAIKEIFSKNHLPKDKVSVSIDASRAIIREIFVPFKNEEQIKKTIKGEVEGIVHTYSAEELIVDFYRVAETEKGTHVVISAVPKDVIKSHIQILNKAGIDPVSIDVDFFALFNTLLFFNKIDTDNPLVLIYSEAGYMKFAYISGKKPRFVRATKLPTPQQSFEDVIVILEEAEETPPPSTTDTTTKLTKSKTIWELFVSEIKRLLLTTAEEKEVEKVLFLGAVKSKDTIQTIEWQLQTPVEPIEFLNQIKLPPAKDIRETDIGVSLGLALKSSGIQRLGIDLRKEEFSYQKRFELIKSALTVTLEILIVLMGLILIHFNFKNSDIEKAHNQIIEEQRKVFTFTFPQIKLKEDQNPYEMFKKYFDSEKLILGGGQYPLKKSAFELWCQLCSAISSARDKMRAQKMGDIYIYIKQIFLEQSARRCKLIGLVNEDKIAWKLLAEIKNKKDFSGMKGQVRSIKIKDKQYRRFEFLQEFKR